MSRFMIGAAAVTLLLLSGCSAEENINDSDDLTGQLSDVEVRLSARNRGVSFSTRAAIDESNDNTENVPGIGIFGLARAPINVNHDPDPPVWFGLSENGGETGCIPNLDNAKSSKIGNDIVWDDGVPRYYPLTRFYAYDFYGYYPYQNIPAANYTETSVKVDYNIDGTMDLLWGCATKPDEPYAYSAQYFRRNAETNAEKPNIELKHLLTRLVFYVVPWDSYDGSEDYTMASRMQVESVQLVDVNTHCSVVIADKSDYDEETKELTRALTDRISLRDNTKESLYLCDADGEKMAPVHLPAVSELTDEILTEGIRIGESIMLYPGETRYRINLILTMDGVDDPFPSEIPLYLAFDGSQAFQQGKSYKVKIMVSGPRAVELQATVEPWDEEDGPTIYM